MPAQSVDVINISLWVPPTVPQPKDEISKNRKYSFKIKFEEKESERVKGIGKKIMLIYKRLRGNEKKE